MLALHDRARSRHLLDAGEITPLDMTDHGAAHRGIIADLTDAAAAALQGKMEAVTECIPPFERFYVEHRDEVFGYLRRLLGQRAEDAWQETFLRALRAYDRLDHARHLRAWVFTIATNVAMDELRAKPVTSLDAVDEPATELHRDAFKELEHLTEDLPPTERAAVVLRYGYDLPYEEIANALGSNEQAARAAASSGVRRLRRTHERLA
jgi:RNA polymerase sigma-70 factor (ECF subfamily)